MSKKDNVGCGCKGPLIGRRAVVLGAAGAAVGLSVGGAFADDATMQGPQVGDLLVRATGKDKATPIKVADVEMGAQYPMQAWPADPATGVARDGVFYNVMLLTAYDPADLNEAVRATSADGVLANTIICPHAACEVTDFDPATAVAECPCHFSKFNLKEGGALVNGPATRKLPSISLASDAEGRLIIASGFDSRVGGDAE
ncbi:Rieske 2Fe-2S domain-containing protein [Devosia sp. A449]